MECAERHAGVNNTIAKTHKGRSCGTVILGRAAAAAGLQPAQTKWRTLAS